MDDFTTITLPQLTAALAHWEQDARDGKCRPLEETQALSVWQVAAENAHNLWASLSGAAHAA